MYEYVAINMLTKKKHVAGVFPFLLFFKVMTICINYVLILENEFLLLKFLKKAPKLYFFSFTCILHITQYHAPPNFKDILW